MGVMAIRGPGFFSVFRGCGGLPQNNLKLKAREFRQFSIFEQAMDESWGKWRDKMKLSEKWGSMV